MFNLIRRGDEPHGQKRLATGDPVPLLGLTGGRGLLPSGTPSVVGVDDVGIALALCQGCRRKSLINTALEVANIPV